MRVAHCGSRAKAAAPPLAASPYPPPAWFLPFCFTGVSRKGRVFPTIFTGVGPSEHCVSIFFTRLLHRPGPLLCNGFGVVPLGVGDFGKLERYTHAFKKYIPAESGFFCKTVRLALPHLRSRSAMVTVKGAGAGLMQQSGQDLAS